MSRRKFYILFSILGLRVFLAGSEARDSLLCCVGEFV